MHLEVALNDVASEGEESSDRACYVVTRGRTNPRWEGGIVQHSHTTVCQVILYFRIDLDSIFVETEAQKIKCNVILSLTIVGSS